MAQTIAERIAEKFENDGTTFRTPALGIPLTNFCARLARRDRSASEHRRFDFADGSSIVIACGAWDLGLPGTCFCWAGADRGRHGERCQERSTLVCSACAQVVPFGHRWCPACAASEVA